MQRHSTSYRRVTAAELRESIAARERQLEERNRDPLVLAETAIARAEAEKAAHLLRDQFCATRARLFGSLARGDASEDFDIDIAVEGVPRLQFFKAWGAAGLIVSRKLDLVDVADATPLLRQRIEEDGVDLL